MRSNAHIFNIPLITALCLLWLNLPMISAQQNTVAHQINDLLRAEKASNTFWSIHAVDSNGNTLYALNGNKLIRPASNLKLLTSAAVLDFLGPGFRFTTPVYTNGTVNDSTLKGDLIIPGRGDPTISGTLNGERPFSMFAEIAQELQYMGIQQIQGNIIGNTSYFDDQPYPKGWEWDDLSFYYGVSISALSFNNNCVDLEVKASGSIGDSPEISWFPFNTDYVEFINKQTIRAPKTDYDEFYQRLPGSNTILLGSDLPQYYVETECLSVPRPGLFFADTFKKFLELTAGIDVTGEALVEETERNWADAGLQLLHLHHSEPLSEIIEQLNKESDNFYAEMLAKAISAISSGEQGTTEVGLAMMKEFAHIAKADTSLIAMSDASGMASRNLITTKSLTAILNSMKSHRFFNTYKQSLSVAGVDGTLSHRMKSRPLRENVIGKSGYISGVRTLSGYLSTKAGRTITFSLAANNYVIKTSRIDSLQEEILQILYNNY